MQKGGGHNTAPDDRQCAPFPVATLAVPMMDADKRTNQIADAGSGAGGPTCLRDPV